MTTPNILSGAAATNGGTIITIPANSYWKGSISLSAAVSGGANTMAKAVITIVGAGSSPAPGDYLRIDLVSSANTLTANVPGDSKTHSSDMMIISGANPVSLVLNTANTSTQSAFAIGELL